ncbi:hypothetical protein D3C87_1142630 [compost metagenome]
MWAAQQAADHLKVSRQAIDKRIRSGRLLAVETGRHGRQIPAWQFTKDGVLNGLEVVLLELVDHDPWMKLAFFLSPNILTEGRRPLDLLRDGESVELVARAARMHGEQVAV